MANPIIPSLVDNSKQLANAKRADQLAERRVNNQINNYENKQLASTLIEDLGINGNLNSPQIAPQVDKITPAPNGYSGLTWQNQPNPIPSIPGLFNPQTSLSVIPGVTLGVGFLTCTGVSNICNPVPPINFGPSTVDYYKAKEPDIISNVEHQDSSQNISTCSQKQSDNYNSGINSLNQYVLDNNIPSQIISGSSNDNSVTVPLLDGNRGIDNIQVQIDKLLGFTSKTAGISYADVSFCNLVPVSYIDSMKCIDDNTKMGIDDTHVYSKDIRNKILLRDGRGFSGPGSPDKVNILTVLDNKGVANTDFEMNYDTDTDDIIAFYFHDLVNDRYIPFRATVKGVNEQAQAEWSDVNYIGRADKLFNYKGFSRTLGFNFTVVASSLLELMPMWQRINYLMTSVKPSGYTNVTNSANNIVSHFIIPPMMTVTIGNMYREQPIVIDNIGLTIPDEAQWETLSEDLAQNNQWSYFKDIIKIYNPDAQNLNNAKGIAAQFPRVVEITIQSKLLEQMLPQIGQHNFGTYTSGSINAQSFSGKLIVG